VAGLRPRFEAGADGQRVFLGAQDVTAAIRTPDMSLGASTVSARAPVRAGLLDLQRRLALADPKGAVLEGRDIGTVVFPEAGAKFFVTASLAERARRRWEELRGKGVEEPLVKVRDEMAARDRNDSSRSCSPLCPAPDAVTIDTTGLTPAQVVEKMAARIAGARGGSARA
jgi:cytidylate kinase